MPRPNQRLLILHLHSFRHLLLFGPTPNKRRSSIRTGKGGKLASRRRKLWSTNTLLQQATPLRSVSIGISPGKHARNSLAPNGTSCAQTFLKHRSASHSRPPRRTRTTAPVDPPAGAAFFAKLVGRPLAVEAARGSFFAASQSLSLFR